MISLCRAASAPADAHKPGAMLFIPRIWGGCNVPALRNDCKDVPAAHVSVLLSSALLSRIHDCEARAQSSSSLCSPDITPLTLHQCLCHRMCPRSEKAGSAAVPIHLHAGAAGLLEVYVLCGAHLCDAGMQGNSAHRFACQSASGGLAPPVSVPSQHAT